MYIYNFFIIQYPEEKVTIDNIKAVMEHIRLNQQRVGMYIHTSLCICSLTIICIYSMYVCYVYICVLCMYVCVHVSFILNVWVSKNSPKIIKC